MKKLVIFDRKLIVAVLQEIGDFKLVGREGVFTVADEMTVEPNVNRR